MFFNPPRICKLITYKNNNMNTRFPFDLKPPRTNSQRF